MARRLVMANLRGARALLVTDRVLRTSIHPGAEALVPPSPRGITVSPFSLTGLMDGWVSQCDTGNPDE